MLGKPSISMSAASPLQCWLDELPPTDLLTASERKALLILIGLPIASRKGCNTLTANALRLAICSSLGVLSTPGFEVRVNSARLKLAESFTVTP